MVNTDFWIKVDDLRILVFLLCLPTLTLMEKYCRASLLHCQSQLKRYWSLFLWDFFLFASCTKVHEGKKENVNFFISPVVKF